MEEWAAAEQSAFDQRFFDPAGKVAWNQADAHGPKAIEWQLCEARHSQGCRADADPLGDREARIAGEGHVRWPSQALFLSSCPVCRAPVKKVRHPATCVSDSGEWATRPQNGGIWKIRQGVLCKILRQNNVDALDEVHPDS